MHSGISVAGWCFGAAVGDYDNDGFDDLFITCLQGNRLYHNNRNGTFTDVPTAPESGERDSPRVLPLATTITMDTLTLWLRVTWM